MTRPTADDLGADNVASKAETQNKEETNDNHCCIALEGQSRRDLADSEGDRAHFKGARRRLCAVGPLSRWCVCRADVRCHRLSGLDNLWQRNARLIGGCGLSEALRRSIKDRRIAGTVGDRHARALISS